MKSSMSLSQQPSPPPGEPLRKVLSPVSGTVRWSSVTAKALGISASSLYWKLEDIASGVDVKAPISVHERGLSAVRESHVRYHQ